MGAEAGFYAYDQPSESPADDNIKTVDSRLFVCPTRPKWINNRNYTYGYNYQFLGNSRFRVDGGGSGSPQYGFINFPVYTYDLHGPSATVMAATALETL